jgi:hypothetical protein
MRIASIPAATLSAGLALVHAPAWGGDCEQGGAPPTYLFQRDSGPQPAPADGMVTAIVFEDMPDAASPYLSGPTFKFEASADLGLLSERFFARVNGGDWEELVFPNARDCADPADCTNSGPRLPLYYGQIWDPTVVIEIFASASVDAKTCPDGWIRVQMQYIAFAEDDCNGNRRADACDIADGILADCDGNGWADECQLARFPEGDCDGNGIPDCCDALDGARDCNLNRLLDRCEIAADPALDCNGNGMLDACELRHGLVTDADLNGVPDSCDVAAGRLDDCDRNGIADIVDLEDPSRDLDRDFVLDSCGSGNPDIDPDGNVGAADLAILLSRWGTASPNADLDGSGSVGAADLAALLAAWGPVGRCGDGVLDPGENCCNCPEDAGCGAEFDCYYGVCVPCAGKDCPPVFDDCELLYGAFGHRPPCYGCTDPSYGIDPIPICYGPSEPASLLCGYGLLAPSRSHRFAMRVLDSAPATFAFASVGFILLLAMPVDPRRLRRTRAR